MAFMSKSCRNTNFGSSGLHVVQQFLIVSGLAAVLLQQQPKVHVILTADLSPVLT